MKTFMIFLPSIIMFGVVILMISNKARRQHICEVGKALRMMVIGR